MTLSESFYLFALPPELLDSLVVRELGGNLAPPSELERNEEDVQAIDKSGRSCNTCPDANYPSLEEQRAHFRTDWHRYNVKLKIAQKNTVSSAEFDLLIDGLEGSISGSDSDSGDEDDLDPTSDAVSKLMNKISVHDDRNFELQSRTVPRSPLLWFHSAPTTQLGIYRSNFSINSEQDASISDLKQLQISRPEGRIWVVLMVAAGHFAGVVVQVAAPESEAQLSSQRSGKKGTKPSQRSLPPPYKILKQKTFHRYTTRRKQGGGQSANDNAKGAAHSAGATLRRYGEQALQEDIRNLLIEWTEEIDACERIWMRASGKTRKIFWDYKDALLSKDDNRLRGFPFPTRRPTHSETLRCINELTRLKVTHFTEAELKEQDDAFLASLPKPKPTPAPPKTPEKTVKTSSTPKLTPDQESLANTWDKAVEMIRKGRLVSLQQFWEREGRSMGDVNAVIPEWAGERSMTMLQIAAIAGQEQVIQWLLEGAKADPTIRVPDQLALNEDSDKPTVDELPAHQTAYDLASTRESRNVFRRCAGAHPDWWDWFGAGHVPATLTQEMEERRDEKKRQRRGVLKDKMRERIAQEKTTAEIHDTPQEVRFEEPTSGPRKLGGKGGTQGDVNGLTPEMKMRIERERRARAAEARLKSLGGA